jgi:hypothetical protein
MSNRLSKKMIKKKKLNYTRCVKKTKNNKKCKKISRCTIKKKRGGGWSDFFFGSKKKNLNKLSSGVSTEAELRIAATERIPQIENEHESCREKCDANAEKSLKQVGKWEAERRQLNEDTAHQAKLRQYSLRPEEWNALTEKHKLAIKSIPVTFWKNATKQQKNKIKNLVMKEEGIISTFNEMRHYRDIMKEATPKEDPKFWGYISLYMPENVNQEVERIRPSPIDDINDIEESFVDSLGCTNKHTEASSAAPTDSVEDNLKNMARERKIEFCKYIAAIRKKNDEIKPIVNQAKKDILRLQDLFKPGAAPIEDFASIEAQLHDAAAKENLFVRLDDIDAIAKGFMAIIKKEDLNIDKRFRHDEPRGMLIDEKVIDLTGELPDNKWTKIWNLSKVGTSQVGKPPQGGSKNKQTKKRRCRKYKRRSRKL